MTAPDLAALGHEPMPLAKVIRAKCLDCCVGQVAEVRRCTAASCALWPYRMGNNPLHGSARKAPTATDD